MVHPIGKVGFYLASKMFQEKANGDPPHLQVELVIRGQKRFQALEAYKGEIEKKFGQPLNWQNPPDQIRCRVSLSEPADITDEDNWAEQCAWLKKTLERFQAVFVSIIMKLDHSAFKE